MPPSGVVRPKVDLVCALIEVQFLEFQKRFLFHLRFNHFGPSTEKYGRELETVPKIQISQASGHKFDVQIGAGKGHRTEKPLLGHANLVAFG